MWPCHPTHERNQCFERQAAILPSVYVSHPRRNPKHKFAIPPPKYRFERLPYRSKHGSGQYDRHGPHGELDGQL
jgi:hypothetical protein